MYKIFVLLIAIFTVSTSSSMDVLSRTYTNPQKVSFFSRTPSDTDDLEALLRTIKEFLYDQGLYDAADIVTTIEKNIAENSAHTSK